MTPSLSSLLWFVAVLAAIPAALWLLRQSPLGRLHGLRPGTPECPMRTLASHALSPNQKVVTVEVGQGLERRWLVLGVTPSSITTLHQFAPAVAPAAGTAPAAWLHPGGQAPATVTSVATVAAAAVTVTTAASAMADAPAVADDGTDDPAADAGTSRPQVAPPVLDEVLVPGEAARAADDGDAGATLRPFGELLARLRRRPQAAPVSDTSFADTCPSLLFDDEPEARRA